MSPPVLWYSDGLPTAIGVGGNTLTLSELKQTGSDPSKLTRHFQSWRRPLANHVWDAESCAAGYFDSPAGSRLPDGLDSVLAVQAMFPPTSRHEMRGEHGENELGC